MVRRLVIGFGSAFVILSLCSSCVLYFLIKKQLRTEQNLLLQDRLSAINTLLKSPVHGIEGLHRRIDQEWPTRGGEKAFVIIRDGDDKLFIQSPFMVPLDNNYMVQTTLIENSVGLKNPTRVTVAIGNHQAREFLATLLRILTAVFAFNLFVSLFVIWQIIRREMRPLQKLADIVARIDSARLHERISAADFPKELHVLADSFNHTLDRLYESFGRLTQFSSDIAHEMRTPLSNIIGSMEVGLSRTRDVESYREILGSTVEECQRLGQIIESLLFLARAENQNQQLSMECFDVGAEIARVIEFLEPLASEKNIALKVAFEGTAKESFYAEKTLFQRVIVNIVQNAIHYTGLNGHVDVSYRFENAKLSLIIKDNGVGIPASDVPKIFERFYRVDPSRNLNSGGSGLGLAIVKSIIELHRGQIEVESAVGIGTEVKVEWPCADGSSGQLNF